VDGQLIATIIGSSVVVGGVISGGFWKVVLMISDQSKSIGKLEGKIDGLDKRMEGFDASIGRLDKRMNGFVDK